MPMTKTQICNMALGHVGINSTITNVDTETSPEASACRNFYDICRDIVLENRPWPFATRRVTLSLTGTAYDEWDYSYAYPSNCVRANKIVDIYSRTFARERKIPFRVVDNPSTAGKLIMTDEQDAILEFNIKEVDPARFTITFAHGLALLLGSYIAMPLKVNPKISTFVSSQAAAWLGEAAVNSLTEAGPDEEPVSEFHAVRF